MTATTNPTENNVENTVNTVVENEISDTDYQGGRIIHEGFDYNDIRQKYVNYAYKLGGWDLVYLMECENGNWDTKVRGDNGNAYGLCQMNRLYHKDIPQEYFDGVWQVQVEYCYQKWKGGTKFYGPSRIVKGKRCSEYVKDRFTYIE